ncbi:hypothetical protein [Microbacterium sp.]|uniref:hypothetical protein n=1 Tax=Microbacterium sp. TaxID=51671 RepID=UPI00289DCA36|nr:hypothetical protein [Microbacterium sp.]
MSIDVCTCRNETALVVGAVAPASVPGISLEVVAALTAGAGVLMPTRTRPTFDPLEGP